MPAKNNKKSNLLCGWWSTGAAYPHWLWMLLHWQHSEPERMWPWPTSWASLWTGDLQRSSPASAFPWFQLNRMVGEKQVLECGSYTAESNSVHILLRIISATSRTSSDELTLSVCISTCICKMRPFVNSRDSLLLSPCFQLHCCGLFSNRTQLTELSTGLHSIHTSVVRQVWWKEGINNLCSFKNIHKYITENIKTLGKGDIII